MCLVGKTLVWLPLDRKWRARFLVELIGLNEFEKAINQLNESENESAAEARSSKIPYELYRYSDAGRFFLRPS